ncbi:MAG: hypothetical protein RIC55_36840 [Pirellulaceae bacterium]
MKSLTTALICALLGAALSGCWHHQRQVAPDAPAFAVPPTQQSILERINGTSRIYQLQAENARISLRGALLPLSANLAVERPRRMRIRGELVGVNGIDLGSNEEVFWVYSPLMRPPGVYYARHEDYQRSSMAEMLPLRPEWLIEALGVVQVDPSSVEGPYSRGADKLEIRTRVPGIDGTMTKVLVVDATYGWILEQYLYDPQGQPVAQVTCSEHRYYRDVDVSLPHQVEIHLPKTGATVRLDVGGYMVNQLVGDPAQLWSMPRIDGAPPRDVTQMSNVPLAASGPFGSQPAPAPAAASQSPPNYGLAPSAARPQYRGFPGR